MPSRIIALMLVLPAIGCAYAEVPPESRVAERPPAFVGCSQPRHEPRPDGLCTASSPPLALEKVPPEYPSAAREGGVQGQVTVRACVCEHGRVVDARIETSIPLLDPAAIEAVRQWTFQPASSGDVLVPCWIDVPVRFSLH